MHGVQGGTMHGVQGSTIRWYYAWCSGQYYKVVLCMVLVLCMVFRVVL